MAELTTTPQRLLALLQHGDSQFPSGAFAFSGGLEGLLADGMTTAAALPKVIAGTVRNRWATFDAVVVRLAWRADGSPATLAALDAQLEAALLAPAERLGSARAGAALLTTHLRLGTPGAAALRAQVDAGSMRGHRTVLEGALWRSLGLAEVESAILSGYAFLSSLCTACVRLGRMSALAQQELIAQLTAEIATLAAVALPTPPLPRAFNPLAEVAMMRHRVRDGCLFAT